MDAAGNADPSPAQRAWAIDATAPDTAITSGPAEGATVEAPTAAFGFASGAGRGVRVPARRWRVDRLRSPQAYGPLAVGPHRFEVRARDAVGNTDSSPAARAWTVAAARGGVLSVTVTRQPLKTTLRRGVLVRFSCPKACRPTWRLQLSRADARKLRLSTVIGSGRATRAVTSGSARIKLTARARRALAARAPRDHHGHDSRRRAGVDTERVQLRR